MEPSIFFSLLAFKIEGWISFCKICIYKLENIQLYECIFGNDEKYIHFFAKKKIHYLWLILF